jgi:hypothetical protein
VLFELSNVCELLVMVATASMLLRMTVSVASVRPSGRRQ